LALTANFYRGINNFIASIQFGICPPFAGIAARGYHRTTWQ